VTPFRAELPPGSYRLELRLAGHRPASEALALAPRGERAVRLALEVVEQPRPGVDWTVPGLGLELVALRGGVFKMGTAKAKRDSDEAPVTEVLISKPYWLGRYEVTQDEWVALMGGNPSHFQGGRRPVETVSWEEAMEFGRRLTAREQEAGRLPAGYAYTLPTEAQWEYACRAGTGAEFAGSPRLADLGWYDENSGGQTREVGLRRANPWGLHDMHGNVREWCRDWYAGRYAGGRVTDPQGLPTGSNRVNRGGGWSSGAESCRAGQRFWNLPSARALSLGFRVALAPQG
jgi:formylglycine-generating enzyme required for sulfatase activity